MSQQKKNAAPKTPTRKNETVPSPSKKGGATTQTKKGSSENPNEVFRGHVRLKSHKNPNSPRTEYELSENITELCRFEKDRENFGMKVKLKKQGEQYIAFSNNEERSKAATVLYHCNSSNTVKSRSGNKPANEAEEVDQEEQRAMTEMLESWKSKPNGGKLFADFVRQTHVVQLGYLQEISRILSTVSKAEVTKNATASSLIEDFVSSSGITHLCTLALTNTEDHRWLVSILDIMTAILDSQSVDGVNIGCGILVEHSYAVQAITDMFENRNVDVRVKVTKLLTALMVYNDEGLLKVTTALRTYSDAHNNSSVFEEFVRGVYFETDLNFRCAALQLINAALGYMPEIDERVMARHNLSELGFDSILQEMMKKVHEMVVKLIDEGQISDEENLIMGTKKNNRDTGN
ncbi:hypothetical protein RFI_15215, partial [Reticulomyxa filosa]